MAKSRLTWWTRWAGRRSWRRRQRCTTGSWPSGHQWPSSRPPGRSPWSPASSGNKISSNKTKGNTILLFWGQFKHDFATDSKVRARLKLITKATQITQELVLGENDRLKSGDWTQDLSSWGNCLSLSRRPREITTLQRLGYESNLPNGWFLHSINLCDWYC